MSSFFRKTIKLIAITLSLAIPVTSFSQDYSTESGGNEDDYPCCGPIEVPGYPPEDPPPFDPDDNPGWQGGDGGGGGSGGDNGNGPEPDPAVCLDLQQRKPENCFSDPGSSVNYTPYVNNNYNNVINPYVFPWNVRQFDYLTLPTARSVISTLTSRYYSTGDYTNARASMWISLASYCSINHSTEMQDCLTEQAEFLASVRPVSYGGNSSWYGEVSWGGITVGYNSSWSQGNWVTTILQQVDNDKVCHLWYQHPDQEVCNGGN